jgi:hypothetical protein
MSSHVGALVRSQKAAPVLAATVSQFTGCYQGRISSIKNGLVYVVIPVYNGEREFGPCIMPIGVLGVGPASVDTTQGLASARPVTFTNATEVQIGLLVLVQFPDSGSPWVISIAPKGI